jgi:predicted permease
VTRLLSSLLDRLLRGDDAARSIAGDLLEEYAGRARVDRRAARRWYRREALAVLARAHRLGRNRHTGSRKIAAGAAGKARTEMMRQLIGDARLAVRSLRKEPRFAAVAVATLALGIGLVTAIFSVVNGVLLKPLPYPDADRLVGIWSNAPGLGYDRFSLSPDLYYFFKAENRAFEEMTLMRPRNGNLTGAGDPAVVPLLETTHTYLITHGIAPALGAGYGERDDRPGAPLVAMISHRLWQQRFSGAADAVGRAVQIDGAPATIVAVLPSWLDETNSPDVWIPARLDAANPPTGSFSWPARARLAPGVTAAAAEASLAPLVRRVLENTQTTADYRAFLETGRYRTMVQPVRQDVVGAVERPLWLLLGTVGFVLLIACANVANLCLVRADGRRREVAVRSALGAPRGALLRQQLVDATVLAAIGGIAGVLIAAAAVPALIRLAPSTIPRLDRVSLDPAVLLVAAGATLISALVFGLAPALRLTRRGSLAALRDSSRGATSDRARHRGRQLLVVVQTAMTLVLLVGSGLMARSFSRMLSTDLGVRPDNVLTFRVTLPQTAYGDAAAITSFDERLRERLAAIPDVEAVGATSALPVASSAPGTAFLIDGQPVQPNELPPMLHFSFITPGYSETMGMTLLRGRWLDRRDDADGARSIVVNRVVADRFWPDDDPIGRRLRPSGDDSSPWFTIVGVVAPVRQDGLRRDAPPLVYYPRSADSPRALTYVIRGRSATPDAAAARQAVWSLDANLPLALVEPMTDIVDRSFVQFAFTMLTLGIAAGTALVLGAVGLYGVLAYAVSLRRRELGVRLALGAPRAQVMRAVVGQGLIVAGIGLAIGLAGAAALTRLLGSLLYETNALDATTFAAMSAALLVVALLASYLPARRAASVSPVEALRDAG